MYFTLYSQGPCMIFLFILYCPWGLLVTHRDHAYFFVHIILSIGFTLFSQHALLVLFIFCCPHVLESQRPLMLYVFCSYYTLHAVYFIKSQIAHIMLPMCIRLCMQGQGPRVLCLFVSFILKCPCNVRLRPSISQVGNQLICIFCLVSTLGVGWFV